MPTVEGEFFSPSPGVVVGMFVIDDIENIFQARVEPPVPQFTSTIASLTYDSPDQLTGSFQFTGRIGTGPFTLTLESGATLEGELNAPGDHPATDIEGYGAWNEQ